MRNSANFTYKFTCALHKARNVCPWLQQQWEALTLNLVWNCANKTLTMYFEDFSQYTFASQRSKNDSFRVGFNHYIIIQLPGCLYALVGFGHAQ
jgi:hypothetical protein